MQVTTKQIKKSNDEISKALGLDTKILNLLDIVPSQYQADVFNAIANTLSNILIGATAGSGKTTTIVQSLKLIPKHKDVIFLAFNKSIVEELRTRVPANVHVSTLHSFGCRQIMKHFSGVKMNENKCFKKALKLFEQWNVGGSIGENKYTYCYRVARIVDLMRLTLTTQQANIEKLADKYGILVFSEEVTHAMELFRIIRENIQEIDFVDMVFQVAVRDFKMPKFDYVFIDEIQDLNKAQQAIIKKIIRPETGRLIAVGDPNQSIYGFAGADHESFNRMKKLLPDTIELPLSICYRCAKNIVLEAQQDVPTIEYSETAEEGIVLHDIGLAGVDMIKQGDWVLCRNLKPLVYVFRKLIRDGKKANIKGREIGEKIVNLINKTKKDTVEGAVKMLEVEKIKLRGKLFRKGFAKPEEHPRFIELNENIEIIKILSEDAGIKSVKKLISKIQSIFLDDEIPGIVLSTIHKSKGLEADRVFILNRNLIPSKYAVTESELVQEKNLLFVARTRAKRELIYMTLTQEEMDSMLASDKN